MENVSSVFEPLINPTDASLLRLRCDSQSLSYYGDISRYICKFFLAHETVSVLDIGPRTGAGLALLRLLHHPLAFTRLKFDPVVGIDVDPDFQRIAESEFGDIHAVTGDIFDLEGSSYDIVVCSHTIDSVPDPDRFLEKMTAISRRGLFLAGPMSEQAGAEGDQTPIDRAFFERHGFHDIEVYESHHWHAGICFLAFKDTGK